MPIHVKRPIKNENNLAPPIKGKASLSPTDISTDRLRTILASQPDCVKMVDENFKLLDMNPAGLLMIEATSMEEVRGAYLLDLVDQKYHERFKETVRAAFRGETMEAEFEITGLMGVKRRMSQRSAPLYDPDDPQKVIEMVAVTRDISKQYADKVALREVRDELVVALKEAQIANKTKSNFLASMSHDLRTPLNAIIGFSDIMTDELFGKMANKKYSEYTRDINEAGNYLLTLVNDILEISTLEAGQKTLNVKAINVEEIVNSCYGMLNMLARTKGLDFKVDIPNGLPPLNADHQALMQILINLGSNAIKFTPQGGTVTMQVNASENDHIIKMIDTGIGISQRDLKVIQIPFKRIETAFSYNKEEGTGLGLAIATSLVELHGGEFKIESQLGKGTSVTITFPILKKG